MNDSDLDDHLQAAFGLQVFERARGLGQERYGLAVLTREQWDEVFSSALYQSLPEDVGDLYRVACHEGIGSLMIGPNDETGAGFVVRSLYGRYFDSHGSYERYVTLLFVGTRTVVAKVSQDGGLCFVGVQTACPHRVWVPPDCHGSP